MRLINCCRFEIEHTVPCYPPRLYALYSWLTIRNKDAVVDSTRRLLLDVSAHFDAALTMALIVRAVVAGKVMESTFSQC